MLCDSPYAQALVSSLGWTYLDVRSKLETEDVGKVRIAVNIPCVNCTKKWSSEQGKKVIQKEENEAFLAMVRNWQVANDIIGCRVGLGLTSITLWASVCTVHDLLQSCCLRHEVMPVRGCYVREAQWYMQREEICALYPTPEIAVTTCIVGCLLRVEVCCTLWAPLSCL